jgi:CRP-like cAMP-binding protein
MPKEPTILERKFVPAGAMILRQGDDGNTAFLIQSGSVQVFAQHGDKAVILATLKTGQIFGEMALVVDEPRGASVKALEDTTLIGISRESFKQKLSRSDPTIKAIMTMLTDRITSANTVVMGKNTDTKGLTDTARHLYESVLQELPRAQQRTFQNTILPKLNDLLEALKAFQDRYSK